VRRIVALLVAVGVTASGATAASSVAPKTILKTKGDVVAFAQDGRRLAVATTGGRRRCWFSVRVHDLGRRRDHLLASPKGPTCAYGDQRWNELHFTFAGRTGLWVLSTGAHFDYQDVTASSTADPRDGQLIELVYDNDAYTTGDHFADAAGDGSTLVYAAYAITVTGDEDCDLNYTCTVVTRGGGVWRVIRDGNRHVRIPGIGPTYRVAVSGRLLALVAATPDLVWTHKAKSSPVELRDAETGRLKTSFAVPGGAEALAVARGVIAVLAVNATGARIDRYSASSGALLGSTPVASTTAHELSAAGNRVLFRNGRTIFVLDAPTGSSRTLTTAKHVPIGLSIEGNRVAWGESLGKRGGAVRAVTVG
jgi:hypothetical protein